MSGIDDDGTYTVYLGMYSPLQPWIDQTWRPGEIELVR